MAVSASKRKIYRERIRKSLCRGKTAKKCKKVKGCKTASGTKRRFCRKRHSVRHH
jgi:hypothetical protein